MKLSELMSQAGLSLYAEVALVLFLAAFAAILYTTFRPGAARRMHEMSRLPLDDEGAGPPREGETR